MDDTYVRIYGNHSGTPGGTIMNHWIFPVAVVVILWAVVNGIELLYLAVV